MWYIYRKTIFDFTFGLRAAFIEAKNVRVTTEFTSMEHVEKTKLYNVVYTL